MSRKKASQPRRPRSAVVKDQDIGARLRAMRIAQGLSQEELGAKLDVSFQQVQKYEKGTNRISGVRIMMLAQLLHTSPHEILGWDSGVNNVQVFNTETYKLAAAFDELKPELKPLFRGLIERIMSQQ